MTNNFKSILTLTAVTLSFTLGGCFNSATNSPLSLGDPAAPVSSCALACNHTLLNVSKDFNVLVFQDFSAPSSDVEGRLAAGRNINIANYSVGATLTSDPTRFDVIAGGNVNFASGDVPHGGIAYGGTFSGSASSLSPPVQNNFLSFTAAEVQLEGISDSLAGLTANQTASIQYSGGRAFTTLNATLSQNIFLISSNDISNTHTLTINGPSTASVIVNVSGTSATLSNFGIFFTGGITRDHVIFNFKDATSLTLGNISIEGTILAPHADVSFPSGQLNGQLVAHSMSGAGQFNNTPYAGCLPVVSSLNYFKDSFTDSTDGNSTGGTLYEMYGMAIKQVGEYIIVGVNTNFPLHGEVYSGTQISWGDFVMNFASDQSSYDSAAHNTTFAVKFMTNSASDSSAPQLGLYQNVIAQGVENSHYGWGTWGQYSSYVLGQGASNPLLAGKPNSYFDNSQSVPNSIASGTFVSNTGFQMLTQADLSALGIDFPTGLSANSSQLGSLTFGFSFKRTAAMNGNFTGHLGMECANDVVAFPGTLQGSCH